MVRVTLLGLSIIFSFLIILSPMYFLNVLPSQCFSSEVLKEESILSISDQITKVPKSPTKSL